jgi:hypothetical protein
MAIVCWSSAICAFFWWNCRGNNRIQSHFPLDPLLPNATTIAAMKAARAGKTKAFDSVEALMADLDADD